MLDALIVNVPAPLLIRAPPVLVLMPFVLMVVFPEPATVRVVPVQTGIADNNFIEIRSGIKEGDEIVSGSYVAISKDLKDGSKVKTEVPKDAK